MHVLVTGGAGYVGAVLVPLLLEEGHEVTVLDCGMFGIDHLPAQARTIVDDIRDWRDDWLDGAEAVIHLAGISNDPMANLSPRLNYEVNAAATALIAQSAKRRGLRRLIMASSCSVYGFQEERDLDEDTPTTPASAYGISKLMAERALQVMADESFRPIILRKGTVIGLSPRMRYDLAVNTMLKTALSEGRVVIRNPSIWRPIIDVRDAAAAYVCALRAPPNVFGVFNIAHANFTMAQLADEVSEALRELGVNVPVIYENLPELRSYRVSTCRAQSELRFTATIPVKASVSAMFDAIQRGEAADLDDPRYRNVEWMKMHLLDHQPH